MRVAVDLTLEELLALGDKVTLEKIIKKYGKDRVRKATKQEVKEHGS